MQEIDVSTTTTTTTTPAVTDLVTAQVNSAVQDLLERVVRWGQCHYGMIATVSDKSKQLSPQQQPKDCTITTKMLKTASVVDESMTDISELDQSYPDSSKKILTVHEQLASFRVPIFKNGTTIILDEEENVTDESSESEMSQQQQRVPSCRPSQPVTTYGPMYCFNVAGSVTLSMDRLRFEPFNPLDKVHHNRNHGTNRNRNINIHHKRTASEEYNYLEVYWDKVIKYQLTPRRVTKQHLFKLIYKKQNDDDDDDCDCDCDDSNNCNDRNEEEAKALQDTKELVLKLKNRAELERILQDVKLRVILPSRNNNNKSRQRQKQRRQRRRRQQQQSRKLDDNQTTTTTTMPKTLNECDVPSSITSSMSSKERASTLPPSLPTRWASDQSLLHSSAHQRPQQQPPVAYGFQQQQIDDSKIGESRPTKAADASAIDFNLSFVSDYTDEYDTDSDIVEENENDIVNGFGDDHDRKAEAVELWSVDDILKTCQEAQKTVIWSAQKRAYQPEEVPTDKQVMLLPKEWQLLFAIPIMDSKRAKLQAVVVLALKSFSSLDISMANYLESWTPHVSGMIVNFLQRRQALIDLVSKTQIISELEQNLNVSVAIRASMINQILPSEAVAKLKVQPQEWKPPAGSIFQPPSVPDQSAVAMTHSITNNSSISGSMHSRYGLLVGDVPSLDSYSTIQIPPCGNGGGTTGELYSVAEAQTNKEEKTNGCARGLPKRERNHSSSLQRAPSTSKLSLGLRGLQRQGSAKNRAGETRPIFSRMDSKRSMLMMRGSSARGGGLVRMDSAKPGNVTKADSSRFLPRLDSLRSLGEFTIGSVNTCDQSFRTIYSDDGSIYTDDLSEEKSTSTKPLSVLSQSVSCLTNESSVRYINSSGVLNAVDIQAMYVSRQSNATVLYVSIMDFDSTDTSLTPSEIMDAVAKLMSLVDQLSAKYQMIQVGMTGNSILIVGGLFGRDESAVDAEVSLAIRDEMAAVAALELAKELVSKAQTIRITKEAGDWGNTNSIAKHLQVRVGIHVTNVLYGVVGTILPRVSCLGTGMSIAESLSRCAPSNGILVSKEFHDVVGEVEKGWNKAVTVVGLHGSNRNSTILEQSQTNQNIAARSIETFTLDPPPPPPPEVDGGSSLNSSALLSMPSLASMGTTSGILATSGHRDTVYSASSYGESMLGSHPYDDSFVSGEFYID